MKSIKVIIVTIAVFLILAIGMMGYVIGLSQGIDKQIDKFKYAGYESDDTNYINGQLLLPDYIHPKDTLVVTNAPYLNECLARPDVGSDGDIMEILNETTERCVLPNVILVQNNDGPDRISVIYTKDCQDWALDYLTKKEYDSLFSKFVNYKP